MLDWLKQFWTGSEPVEFESAFGLEKSIERLKAATGRSFLSGLARECAVGTVKESRVSLQRVIPMVNNSFKPFFVGRFVQSGGTVKLVGRFTTNWFVKAFMTAWLSGGGIVRDFRHSRFNQVTAGRNVFRWRHWACSPLQSHSCGRENSSRAMTALG